MNEMIKFCAEDMKLLLFYETCWCSKPKNPRLPLCPSCFSKLVYPFDSKLKESIHLVRKHNDKECWSLLIKAYSQAVEYLDDIAV